MGCTEREVAPRSRAETARRSGRGRRRTRPAAAAPERSPAPGQHDVRPRNQRQARTRKKRMPPAAFLSFTEDDARNKGEMPLLAPFESHYAVWTT